MTTNNINTTFSYRNTAQRDIQCTNTPNLGKAYFSSEVLKDGSTVNSCCGSYTTMAGCASLQVPVDTTHRELVGNKHKTAVWVKQEGGRESRRAANNEHRKATKELERGFTCSPALWERDTAFALALPLSFPALPPACMGKWSRANNGEHEIR